MKLGKPGPQDNIKVKTNTPLFKRESQATVETETETIMERTLQPLNFYQSLCTCVCLFFFPATSPPLRSIFNQLYLSSFPPIGVFIVAGRCPELLFNTLFTILGPALIFENEGNMANSVIISISRAMFIRLI